MKMLMPILAVAGLALTSGEAAAQDAGGANGGNFYAGAQAGVTFVPDSDVSVLGVDVASLSYGTGFNVGGMIGYKFANGFRVEGEYAYRQADVDSISALGQSLKLNGDVSAHAFMVNAWYEAPVAQNIFAYVGGGIGLGLVEAELSAPSVMTTTASGDDTLFAYQAGLGVGYEFSKGLVGYADYRYWATSEADFQGVGVDISTHNISAGIRFHF